MDLIKICEFLSASNLRNYRDDDLWIDRLSHRYSVVLFTIFAVLVTTKAYIGDPIGICIFVWSLFWIRFFILIVIFLLLFESIQIVGRLPNSRHRMNGTPKRFASSTAPTTFQLPNSKCQTIQNIDIQIEFVTISGLHLFCFFKRNSL